MLQSHFSSFGTPVRVCLWLMGTTDKANTFSLHCISTVYTVCDNNAGEIHRDMDCIKGGASGRGTAEGRALFKYFSFFWLLCLYFDSTAGEKEEMERRGLGVWMTCRRVVPILVQCLFIACLRYQVSYMTWYDEVCLGKQAPPRPNDTKQNRQCFDSAWELHMCVCFTAM